MNLKDKLKSTLFNVATIALSISQNMLILPFLINTWGLQTVGIWQLSTGFITILQSFDQGFQMYITNMVGKELIQKSASVANLFATGLFIVIFGNLILMSVICLFVLLPFVPDYLKIDRQFYYDSLIPLSFFFQYLSTVANTIIVGVLAKIYNNQGFASKSSQIGLIGRFFALLPLMLVPVFGWSLLQSQILNAVLITAIGIYNYQRFKKVFPSLFPWWGNQSFSLLKSQYKIIGGVLLFYVMDPLFMHGTSLIISNTISIEHVTIFNLTRMIPNIIVTGSVILIGSFNGDIMRFHFEHKFEKLASLFQVYWFFSSMLFNFSLACLLYIIQPLFDYLIQGSSVFDYWLSAFLITSVSVGSLSRLILSYFTIINESKKILSNSILRTILSLSLSFVFLKMDFFWGLGLAVLIAEVVSAIVLVKSLTEFWKKIHFQINSSFFTAYIPPILLLLATYTVCFFADGIWMKTIWNTIGIVLLLTYYYWAFQRLSPEIRASISQKTEGLRRRIGL